MVNNGNKISISPVRLPVEMTGNNTTSKMASGSKPHKKINPATVLKELTEKTTTTLPRVDDTRCDSIALAAELGFVCNN
jgi:hypothetical protein